jgi:eukaryotic-like serine/threonine-protein kinase
MISFACSACGKLLQVKDELTGKKAKCPGCGKLTTIPVAGEKLAAALSEPGKVSPGTGSRPVGDGERLHPPKAPAVPKADPDACTLPPANPRGAPQLDDVSGAETVSGGPIKAARDFPAELTDFLAPAQAPDEIGRLGPYRVLAVLGHGGMGVVFRAEDPGL